jgi:lysylphosphatidylglycerol synthetase-like protein (DUF2156 family)
MTDEAPEPELPAEEVPSPQVNPARSELLRLPGLVAIALYLLVLAGVIVLGVVIGRHYPPLSLVFAAAFITASCGLVMLFRWAWSLALAAVLLLAVYNLWIFSTLQEGPTLVQGLLNLVFFLYLVRPEVRARLR